MELLEDATEAAYDIIGAIYGELGEGEDDLDHDLVALEGAEGETRVARELRGRRSGRVKNGLESAKGPCARACR